MSKHQAAVIAIGSELIAGQITNRNAAWISERLFNYGIQTVCHLTVDDRIDDIIKAIHYAKDTCEYLFFTGGLGPTSDDLTRDAIARYLGRDLVYHPESWDKITTFFQSLGREPAESNRQQCYFPQDATVLKNDAGTANGFYVRDGHNQIFVLPGPPNEIASIWPDQVVPLLANGPKWLIRKWRTIGKGESDLAQLVTPVVSGHDLEVAYRAHAPYVETKLKFLDSDEEKFRELCRQMKSTLLPWLYEEDDDNYAEMLGGLLSRFDNGIIDDTATSGYLAEHLGPALRGFGTLRTSLLTSWELVTEPDVYLKESLQLADDSHVALGVAGFNADYYYAVGLKTDNALEIETFPSPYPGRGLLGRNQKAIAALAVKTWVRWLMNSEELPTALS